MSDGQDKLTYTPTPTFAAFHADDSLVRAVMGPFASGKSTGMVMELLIRAMQQKAHGGVRYSRALVVRNTYAELKSTTIRTFLQWLGPLGEIAYDSPIRFKSVRSLRDGTVMDFEVWFLPLDREDDVKKLRSLEVTFAWINEASEVPGNVLDQLRGRIGRYPPPTLGGPSWRGIIMDTNPPPVRSWFYDLFEVRKPENHKLFRQPPALLDGPEPGTFVPNPEAENIRPELGGYQYYFNQVAGADESFIKVFVQGQYGQIFDGRPVYSRFDDRIHVSKEPLQPNPLAPLEIGMDFGLNPAAVFTQLSPRGGLYALDEIAPANVTFEEFVTEMLVPKLRERFRGIPVQVYGDPAGASRNSLSSKTVYEILRERGIAAVPARTNDLLLRRDAVTYFLERQNGFLLDPRCRILREGFLGGYRFAKQSGRQTSDPKPEKNEFSHIHDALQYVALNYYQTAMSARRRPLPGVSGPQRRFRYA